MHQSFLPVLTAVMTFIAAIFNIKPAAVPAKGELPHESEPAQIEQRMHDRVDGVDGSVFYISLPRADALTPVYAADFGMSTDSEDNSAAFTAAVSACRSNPGSRLIIPKGKYYFRSESRMELRGLCDTLIDAEGATFVFGTDKYFYIADCDCVEINGLTVEWDYSSSRLGSLVKVRNANADSRTAELVFTEVSDIPEDIPLAAITQYDPQTLTPGAPGSSKECYIYQNPECIKNVEKIEANALRVTHDGLLDFLTDGEVYMLRHYVYGDAVFRVGNSTNVTFDGINIYSAAGMGFVISERTQRFQILNTTIGLAPGREDEYRISATADAVHIADTNGYFRVSGCDFSFMGDDSLNVHDSLICVTERTGANTVKATNAYTLRAGDRVVFCNSDFIDTGFTATVTAADSSSVTFDSLPDGETAGMILCNTSVDSGNYVITDNYFHEQRARGLLLQSSNGLCEGNRFYKTMGEAIKVVSDIKPGLWYEGTGVNNLSIVNNSFERCDLSAWGSVVFLGSDVGGSAAKRTMFSNITVSGNSFAEFPRYSVKIDNCVGGISVTDNSFINSEPLNGSRNRGKIYVGENCSAVTVEGNEWVRSHYSLLSPFLAFKNAKAYYSFIK